MTKPSHSRELIRAYQYLYYVEAISLISDQHYDQLQAAYEMETGDVIPVGSDSASHYTDEEKALAIRLKKA